MAEAAGYELVYVVGLLDIVLIRRDLLRGECVPPLARFSNRVGMFQGCVEAPERKGKWVDYVTWERTGGDVQESRRAAVEQVLLNHMPSVGGPGSPECLGLL
jgi:hypothetical protein